MKNQLKVIILSGYDHNGALYGQNVELSEGIVRIDCTKDKFPGCLEKYKDLVIDYTTVIIDMHGRTSIDPEISRSTLELGLEKGKTIFVGKLIEEVDKVFGHKPLVYNLLNCHSGAGDDRILKATKGSILISHAGAKNLGYSEWYKVVADNCLRYIAAQKTLTLTDIAQRYTTLLPLITINRISFSFNNNGIIERFKSKSIKKRKVIDQQEPLQTEIHANHLTHAQVLTEQEKVSKFFQVIGADQDFSYKIIKKEEYDEFLSVLENLLFKGIITSFNSKKLQEFVKVSKIFIPQLRQKHKENIPAQYNLYYCLSFAKNLDIDKDKFEDIRKVVGILLAEKLIDKFNIAAANNLYWILTLASSRNGNAEALAELKGLDGNYTQSLKAFIDIIIKNKVDVHLSTVLTIISSQISQDDQLTILTNLLKDNKYLEYVGYLENSRFDPNVINKFVREVLRTKSEEYILREIINALNHKNKKALDQANAQSLLEKAIMFRSFSIFAVLFENYSEYFDRALCGYDAKTKFGAAMLVLAEENSRSSEFASFVAKQAKEFSPDIIFICLMEISKSGDPKALNIVSQSIKFRDAKDLIDIHQEEILEFMNEKIIDAIVISAELDQGSKFLKQYDKLKMTSKTLQGFNKLIEEFNLELAVNYTPRDDSVVLSCKNKEVISFIKVIGGINFTYSDQDCLVFAYNESNIIALESLSTIGKNSVTFSILKNKLPQRSQEFTFGPE